MTALTVEADRGLTGGTNRRLPSEISANPFAGSALSYAADGFVRELVAGEPFAGFAIQTIQSRDAATADGSREIEAKCGRFLAKLAVSGAAADDVAHRRKVFASDDNVFSFTASGGTLIGEIIGLEASGVALVLCETAGEGKSGIGSAGIRTLAATGDVTLTTADCDKLILLPSTGAQAITFPLAADCAGRTLCFKKTTADAVAATLTKAGSDTLDGGSTIATIDAQHDSLTLISDGVASWLVIAKQIA